MSSWPELITVN